MSKIPVMEIFGPTVQGEGMMIGRKTMFVRTGGCDFRCVWCDSKFTWDGSQKSVMLSPQDILQKLEDLARDGFDYVTISGGNPALIKQPMADFIRLLQAKNIKTGLETQGSVWQDWFTSIDDLTLSPKPPSSQMPTDWDNLGDIVNRLRDAKSCFSFKIVIFNEEDYAYAEDVHSRWPSVPLFLSVGNDDVKEDGDVSGRLLTRLKWLTEKVVRDESMKSVRVLPQLHVLLWGNKQGV